MSSPALARLRFLLADVPTRWLPPFGSAYLRSHVYRRIGGIDVATDTFIMSRIRITGSAPERYANVRIGRTCLISTNVRLHADAPIVIDDDVTLSPFVEILTALDGGGEPSPVTIGRGSWIALGVRVMPGVTIGRGSVIASGSVVEDDIPANSLAEGRPARVVARLDPDSGHRVP